MGVKEMQGTSAFLEYIGPHGRKRKKSCVYNVQNICHCKESHYYLLKCGGRSFCMNFDDSEETKIKYDKEKNSLYIEKKKEKTITTKNIKDKKIKVEDLSTNKKYLFQLVSKDKKNEKACIFDKESNIGKALRNCRKNQLVELVINNEKRKFKILDIME